MEHINDTHDMQDCIELCQDCEQVCSMAITHCLEMGGPHARPEHIGMLVDCADICATSSRFMMRDSMQHSYTCAACADICDACARDCRALTDDDFMRDCAELCERCAESCRRMATAA